MNEYQVKLVYSFFLFLSVFISIYVYSDMLRFTTIMWSTRVKGTKETDDVMVAVKNAFINKTMADVVPLATTVFSAAGCLPAGIRGGISWDVSNVSPQCNCIWKEYVPLFTGVSNTSAVSDEIQNNCFSGLRPTQFETLHATHGSSVVVAALIWNTISVSALTGAAFPAWQMIEKTRQARETILLTQINVWPIVWTLITWILSIIGAYQTIGPSNAPLAGCYSSAFLFCIALFLLPPFEKHYPEVCKGLNWRLFWLATLGVVPAVGQSINGVMQTRNELANTSGAVLFSALCLIVMGAADHTNQVMRRICALGASIIMVGSFGIAGGVAAISPYASAVQTVAPLTSALLCLCIVVPVVAVVENQSAMPDCMFTFELLARSLFTGAVLCDLSGVLSKDSVTL